MDNYDLRGCFLPDLSGLHTRIYQFRELLRQNLPTVWAHLDELQVDPAYVSQWFLSFFAVTCPLPMLFRIYDVVFAEGESVTIMRVALSLMQKNQARILACAEMGDVMQLLLSRGLWDCYHYNADEFVQDFVGLSAVVSREQLAALEQGYRETQLAAASSSVNRASSSSTPISPFGTGIRSSSSLLAAAATSAPNSAVNLRSTDAGRASNVATAASRFLGRLWPSSPTPKLTSFSQVHVSPSSTISTITPSSSSSTPSSSTTSTTTTTTTTNNPPPHNNPRCSTTTISTTTTLSPGLSAPPRPLSMLRRSASKQSLASTVNSMEAGPSSTSSSSASVLSSASTDATSVSRDSSTADDSPTSGSAIGGPAPSKSTIVNVGGSSSSSSGGGGGGGAKDDTRHLHSQIEDLLTALSELQRNHTLLADQLQKEREERDEDKKAVRSLLDGLKHKPSAVSAVASTPSRDSKETITGSQNASNTDGKSNAGPFSGILEMVEHRFRDGVDDRRSSIPQTKSQLREELARAKEQLANEFAKTQGYNRRILELEQDVSNSKDQLRESHAHVRNLHQDKQRLERQVHGLKTRASDTPSSTGQEATDWFSRTIGLAASGGGGASAGGGGASSTGGGASTAPNSGLRELKLGRSRSTPSQTTGYNKRGSSLTIQSAINGRDSSTGAPLTAPVSEQDSLLLELVQAKTAEAIAKQEAEEAKQRLENLRKAFGLAPGEVPPAAANAGSTATSVAFGVFGRLTGSTAPAAPAEPAKPPLTQAATAPPATTGGGGGGFWGWRR